MSKKLNYNRKAQNIRQKDGFGRCKLVGFVLKVEISLNYLTTIIGIDFFSVASFIILTLSSFAVTKQPKLLPK